MPTDHAMQDNWRRPTPLGEARELLMHCIEREIEARKTLARADAAAHFGAAHAVVLQRSARHAAEDVLQSAVSAHCGTESDPVTVRYRMAGHRDWTGSLSAIDVATARTDTKRLDELTDAHAVELQLTSISQGRTTVSPARTPMFAFATRRAPSIDAVGIEF